jgi:hypothetical protein
MAPAHQEKFDENYSTVFPHSETDPVELHGLGPSDKPRKPYNAFKKGLTDGPMRLECLALKQMRNCHHHPFKGGGSS